MKKRPTSKRGLAIACGLALPVLGSVVKTAQAVEPEKQPIYANIANGSLCGTSSANQCSVPAGQRLIIECFRLHFRAGLIEPDQSRDNGGH